MVNKIVLGTVQFGMLYGINNKSGVPDQETIDKILETAFLKGIQYLDTAEVYGDAQDKIGEFHKKYNFKFKIISKLNSSLSNLPDNLVMHVKENLSVLNVNSLYCYMFHSFDNFKRN